MSGNPRTLLLITGGGGLLFVLLAFAVTSGAVQTLDEQLLLAMRRSGDPAVPRGPAWLLPLVIAITTMGKVWFFTGVVTLTILPLVLRRRNRDVLFLLVVSLGGWLLNILLKTGFARPRPTILPHLIDVTEYSFPSGHAMMSAAIYGAVALIVMARLRSARLRKAVLIAAVLLSGAIGFTRAFLGVHYPSDIVAGWAMGAAWVSVCWYSLKWWERRGSVGTPGTIRKE
jgi:undecaprenyl-diphosphatase